MLFSRDLSAITLRGDPSARSDLVAVRATELVVLVAQILPGRAAGAGDYVFTWRDVNM